MTQNEPPATTLFEMEMPAYGLSPIEKSVKASLDAIAAGPGIPASKMFLAQTAMELARSIDKGNGKGRAVAQESAQLVATLEILDPPTTDAAEEDVPPILRKILDAFGTKPAVPRPSEPTPGDAEKP